MRPNCKICGRLCTSNGRTKYGKRKWKTLCIMCRKRKKSNVPILNRRECNECGFIAIHPCQLDVDHIDGNRTNNDLQNLQILCSNCHRLKTYLNKDWEQFDHKMDNKQLGLF